MPSGRGKWELKSGAALAALLLAVVTARTQTFIGSVIEWDPVGSLSGSWYEEGYEEVDQITGQYRSPWKLLWYDNNGQLEFESTTPRPWVYYPVVFARAGTYQVSVLGGAEAGSVYVQNGDLTLDLNGASNFWSSLTLGTVQQAASLRLSGTGAIAIGGSFLRNGLLSLTQSSSLEIGNLEVSENAGLQAVGSSGLLVRYGLTILGSAVAGENATISIGDLDTYGNDGLWVEGSLSLQDSARLAANIINVSGHLQIGGDAELLVAPPEYSSDAGTVVSDGGLFELNTSSALAVLGDLSVRDADSTLKVWRNHAASGSVEIYDGGRVELSAATSLTVSGDVEIGRAPVSWFDPQAGGTLDLGNGGTLFAAGENCVLRVQGFGNAELARLSRLTGSGVVGGFTEIYFTGGAVYQPGQGAGPLLLSADEVFVGSATYSSDPVSAIYAPGVLGIGGHLRIRGGGLVELEAGDALSAKRITVAVDSMTFNSSSAVLRSRGGISADDPEAPADLTVGKGGLLEAELAVSGRILLESTGRITALGDLVMGDGQSADGFRMSGGTLDVGAHHVILVDYDGASVDGGTVNLQRGSKLESTFLDSSGGTSAIRLGGNAVLRGSGTIASRLLAYGSSMVEVSAFGSMTLDTSAEIYEGTTGDFINFLHIGKSAEFVHNAGWGTSEVGMTWLNLDSGATYRGSLNSSLINLQTGGGIFGSGRVFAEVRGAGVSIDTRGPLYLESAALTYAAVRIGSDSLTYRYGLSLQRGSVNLQGGEIKPPDPFVPGGGATLEFTQTTVSGRGLLRAEQPIQSRGSKFISSGGTLVIDSDLTGNGILVGDVQVNGTITGQDTGYAIPDLLVLSGDAVVFGRGRTIFESGLDFGNGQRLAVQDGAEFAAGSVVRGSGTVVGNVINAGRLEPGNSPGSLLVEGSLTLTSTSRIVMELGGSIAGIDYDQIRANGNLIYGGELVLTLAGPVRAGDSFQLFTSDGSMSGAFSSVAFEETGYAGSFDAQTGRLNVTAAPSAGDADGNGLPDDWENLHFGVTGVNPSADADGDGTSNRSEYIAGTNPRDASSVFRSETRREGSQMILRVPTVTGRRYRLMGSGDLSPGSWIEIDAVDGDGSSLEWERPLSGGRYFLRVEVSIAGV